MDKRKKLRKKRYAAMKRRKLLRILIPIVSVILACLCVFCIVCILGHHEHTISFSIDGDETIYTEYGESPVLSEITAVYYDEFFHKKPVPVPVTVEGTVDEKTIGAYVLTYTAVRGKYSAEVKRYVIVRDTTAPVITLNSIEGYYTVPGHAYEEEGYTAEDLCDGDLTDRVTAEERDGTVYYSVTDSAGNRAEAVREILYVDPTPPVLTVVVAGVGQNVSGPAAGAAASMSVEAGSGFEVPACSAYDEVDGDITDRIEVTSDVNTGAIGTYGVTYRVSDRYGNLSEMIVSVSIIDTTAPVITLSGGRVVVEAGTGFSDPGFSASDSLDGDVTAAVTVSGLPDANTAGSFTCTYTVTDRAGNTATASREILVYRKQSDDPWSDHVVYLTFDDGPGPYTEKLLSVLAKYNVKATFFVTAQSPGYLGLMSNEAAAGHTVAIHTATHRYEEIYASEDAYFADLMQMSSLVEQYTGSTPTIIRFPGGSSNMVSANYNAGIMTRLTAEVENRGYIYADWNVDSNDAGGTTSAEGCAANVINGIAGKSASVVLQHDTYGYSVDAVEEIILWGLTNGYVFRAMNMDSPTAHHTVRN